VTETTAAANGRLWGARAADWAVHAAPITAPAWEAVAEAAAIEAGTRVLDVACGSGEFCRLALDRGAEASGIDASEAMVAIARRRAPGADLRVGPMERLPWEDGSFDVVTGFNAFQFAADLAGALAEARRVARRGGRVAVCNWGRREDNELFAVMAALRPLQPPVDRPSPDPPPLGEPGVLESLAREAGLEPEQAGEVDVPLEAPDGDALARALLAPGGSVAAAIAHAGEGAVRAAILAAAAPFRRADGSYRLENRFRFVVAAA
jgi:SAM-dependent methyltransferase